MSLLVLTIRQELVRSNSQSIDGTTWVVCTSIIDTRLVCDEANINRDPCTESHCDEMVTDKLQVRAWSNY
jgi:hypothetical protein